VTKITDSVKNATDELVNKVFVDQKSRTGSSAACVAHALNNDVDVSAVTAQINANIKKNNPDSKVKFTDAKTDAVAEFYEANKSRPVITKKQTKALTKLANNGGVGPLLA
jgi:hypothetical protein